MVRTLSRRRSDPAEDDYTRPDDAADDYTEEVERTTRNRRSSQRSESDEDSRPRGRRSQRGERSSSSASGGWGAYRTKKEKAKKDFDADKFTVKEGTGYIFCFLEDGPFHSWLEHWVNEIKQGRKSFTCRDETEDCALCDIGHPVSDRAAFNIAVFDDKGNASVKHWTVTPESMKHIEKAAEKKRTSPINKPGLYFEVSKEKGKNQFFTYDLVPLTEDDLREEKIQPLSEDELDDLRKEMFEAKDVVKEYSRSDLQEIADLIED